LCHWHGGCGRGVDGYTPAPLRRDCSVTLRPVSMQKVHSIVCGEMMTAAIDLQASVSLPSLSLPATSSRFCAGPFVHLGCRATGTWVRFSFIIITGF
jgi:hypothetical protein